jgi:hypothetical protein
MDWKLEEGAEAVEREVWYIGLGVEWNSQTIGRSLMQ